MDRKLESIAQAALDQASKTDSLSDLEKAVNIAKTAADARKASSDADNLRRQLGLERLKSMSGLLVPLVSLATLFATIIIQAYQLEATRQQSEDSEWRELLSSLRSSSETFSSDITIAPRLRSFLDSPRHRDQAADMAQNLMGTLTDATGFRKLYNIAFPQIDSTNIDDIIEILRLLTSTRGNIARECIQLNYSVDPDDIDPMYGICRLQPSIEFQKKLAKDPNPRVAKLMAANQAVGTEIALLSRPITDYLRTTYAKTNGGSGGDRAVLNLKEVNFWGGDLSNVDFSSFNMNGAILDHVTLTNAYLTPQQYEYVEFWNSNWWDAADIDPRMLRNNVQYYFPKSRFGFNLGTPEVTRSYYEQRVSKLANAQGESYDLKLLKFE